MPGTVPEPRATAAFACGPFPISDDLERRLDGADARGLPQRSRPGHGVAGAARGDRRALSRARHLARARRGAGDGCARARRRRRSAPTSCPRTATSTCFSGFGLAPTYCSDRAIAELRVPAGRLEERTGRAWNRRLLARVRRHRRRFEPTMSSLAGLAGMRESLRLLNGVDERAERRALAAAQTIADGPVGPRVRALLAPSRDSAIVSARHPTLAADEIVETLRTAGVVGSGSSRAACASRPTSTRRAPTSRRSSQRSPTARESRPERRRRRAPAPEKTQSTWIAASLSPQYGPRLFPIATCAVPAAFSSKRTWPRGRRAGLSPIPSSAITSAPCPPPRPGAGGHSPRRRPRSTSRGRPRTEARPARASSSCSRPARDRQIDDEHTVGAVRVRGDADLPAREVGDAAGLERQGVVEPRPAVYPEHEIRPRRTANPQLTRTLDRRQELARLRTPCPESAATALRAAVAWSMSERAQRAPAVREQQRPASRAAPSSSSTYEWREEADRNVCPRGACPAARASPRARDAASGNAATRSRRRTPARPRRAPHPRPRTARRRRPAAALPAHAGGGEVRSGTSRTRAQRS